MKQLRFKQLWTVGAVLMLGMWSAASTVGFKEAEALNLDHNVVEISVTDTLVVQSSERFLMLVFSEPYYLEEGQTFTESVQLTWTLLEPDSIITGQETSSTVYHVEARGGERQLEAVDGSQDVITAGVAFSWSYADPDAVWVYLEPGTRYAVLGGRF